MTKPRKNLYVAVVLLLLLVAGCTSVIILGKDNTVGAETPVDIELDSVKRGFNIDVKLGKTIIMDTVK